MLSLPSVSANVRPLIIEGKNLRQDMKNWRMEIGDKQGLVLLFISATCPCSQSYFSHLNQMQKLFPQFQFVGIHSNKKLQQILAQNYLQKYDLDFPVLDDRELKFANQYQALKTPHIFVLDRDGKILFQGGATDSRNPDKAKIFYLRDALTSILKGIDIEIKETKTLGCYIER
jgi:peroxiredoxin